LRQLPSFKLAVALPVALAVLTSSYSPVATAKETSGGLPQIDDRYQPLETFARGLFYLETMYVDESRVKPEDMVVHALKGIADKLDPHTVVMPKKAFEQLTIDTQGKFGGVGIIVSQENNKLIVVSPIEDTPAFVAGVKSGDEIIAIDGKDLKDLKNSDAVDHMRGEPGSTLKLKVRREGVKDPLDFELTREIIKVKSVRGQPLAPKIQYVRITSFQEATGEELADILKSKQNEMAGLILDLRDNPGGLLDQAVRVVDLFIESGVIVSTVGRDRSRVEREFATKRGTYTGFPIVILVNGGSASASEIVAGALQDHERALVMGTTTFGKGSVQTLVSLPDGSGLKLTVARYYTPKDRSIQAKGIAPDLIVPARGKPKNPGNKKDDADDEGRKESDLEGHISSNDLSDLAKDSDIMQVVAKWPDNMKNDNQLVTAYTYIKSYARFQKSGTGAPDKPLPPPVIPQGGQDEPPADTAPSEG
jgi:carboxyl-terminal processing protease